MRHSDISDKLVLMCDESQGGRPLGTGFLVNEFGHFITSYHVVKRVVKERDSVKDRISCKWKGNIYRVQYIQPLVVSGFYDALKNAELAIDLAIFQLVIPNKSLVVDHLPVLTLDMNADLPKPVEVYLSGFNCERYNNSEDTGLMRATLSEYQEKNGLWLFAGKGKVWRGYSGSPVLHPQLGEVMGVVVRRFEEDPQRGYVQSLHMLSEQLRSYGYDCEHFFRSPFSLYGRYHERKCRSFENEEWPYAIDKKEFVDAFHFQIGRFPLEKTWGVMKSDNCIPSIVEQLREHPVFCVGYYGMGKTTISKFLFAEYGACTQQEYPVFISLSNIRLSALNLTNWDAFVADKICQDFRQLSGPVAEGGLDVNLTREYFKHFVNHNKCVLIFDGIDEATCNKESIGEFAELLKSLPCNYLLTSRREFFAFFDVFETHMANEPHVVVEFMPWEEKQWHIYIRNLHTKYPNKPHLLKQLEEALSNNEYGTLPERPLFLKMISDLELDNDNELEKELPRALRSNRAAVYHAYVQWKIKDDYRRKMGKQHAEKRYFRKESFRLFRYLADIEYEGSVPAGGAAELLRRSLHDGGAYTHAGFTMGDIQRVCADFAVLDYDFVRKHFLNSSFFSMIRRDVEGESEAEENELFRFSHKSFCEYLVGYNLARSIFGGLPEEAECGRAWDFYQTYEVSTHFRDEMKRLHSADDIEKGIQKPYIERAFEKVLFAEHNLRSYSERFEQVLYYTGKLKIESLKIFEFLEMICSDPKEVHPIYYRTAHISMSFGKSVGYCLKYIEYLIDSFNGSKEAFQWNTDIQINYYGKADLHPTLKDDIDAFIAGGELEGIAPLDIFSYFTCLPFTTADLEHCREWLRAIREVCVERGHRRMAKIVDETLPILESVSGAN